MTTDLKTTILGAVLAVIVAVQPLVSTGSIDWKAVVFGALIALFGYLTDKKDTPKT
jgi:hypothetical protein